jgi:hypothetical protein
MVSNDPNLSANSSKKWFEYKRREHIIDIIIGKRV